MTTQTPIALRFHRKDRACTPCGTLGKHPIYMAETTVGKWWIVRRGSLTETSKSYGQAVAVLAEQGVSSTSCDATKLVGITFDGPAAEQAKAFAVKRMLQRAASSAKHVAGSLEADQKQNERMDLLAAGGEVDRYQAKDDQKLRMKPGTTEQDGEIQTEAFHGPKSREVAEWVQWNRKLATLAGPNDPRRPKNFAGSLDEQTGEWVPYGRKPNPVGVWFTPEFHNTEKRRDTTAERKQQGRERRNLENLVAAIENGTTFTIETETALDPADVLTALVEHKADRKKYHQNHTNHAVSEYSFTMTAHDLHYKMKCSTKEAAKALGKLLRAGTVTKIGRGNYEAV